MKEIINLEGEVWLPVVGYEGLYEVSNLGRVKSLDKDVYSHLTKNQIHYPSKIKKMRVVQGYIKTTLTKDKINKSISVHRLVAMAFIANPQNKREVNHKNGIRADNRVENLEWCTTSENQKHRYTDLGAIANCSKLLLNVETGIFYNSIRDAAKSIGITRRGLGRRFERGTKPNPFIFA